MAALLSLTNTRLQLQLHATTQRRLLSALAGASQRPQGRSSLASRRSGAAGGGGAAHVLAAAAPQQLAQEQQQATQQQQRAAMYYVVGPEGGQPCTTASGPWLEALPRGAYTTARTCGDSVLELSFHLDRLASSARLMIEADAAAAAAGDAASAPAASAAEQAAATVADPARLRPAVLEALRVAVRGHRAACGDATGELKLTVLVTWPGCQQHSPPPTPTSSGASGGNGGAPAPAAAAAASGADVFVHVSPLPPRPQPPVRVAMRGAPRQNAAAKDSEWVRQRKALEEGVPSGTNEVLLVDGGGGVVEGLSSNFFAVVDGSVYTAGEGVLAGTVREVALQVAAREGIPVVLQPPRLQDLPRWEGCFITSTSRLLLPVDEATPMLDANAHAAAAGEGGAADATPQQAAPRSFERGGLVARLEQLVLAEVAACSEPLFD